MNMFNKIAIAVLAGILFMGGVHIAIDSLYPSGKERVASAPGRTVASAVDTRK
jgi:hypothetical protein